MLQFLEERSMPEDLTVNDRNFKLGKRLGKGLGKGLGKEIVVSACSDIPLNLAQSKVNTIR